MGTFLGLFDNLSSIIILLVFAIVAGFYFFIVRTPLEIILMNTTERFKHHMWCIISVSGIYFVVVVILFSNLPININDKNTTQPPKLEQEVENNTNHFTVTEGEESKEDDKSKEGKNTLFNWYINNSSIGVLFFYAYLAMFILSSVIYALMNLLKLLTESQYGYIIQVKNTSETLEYSIVKGVSNGNLLIKRKISDKNFKYQVISLDDIKNQDIERKKIIKNK